MVEFAYNNAKNTYTNYILLELNCDFRLKISYKDDVKPYSKSKTADQLATDLQTFMFIYRENLQHAQKLQKRYHNKHAKPKNYAPEDKVWLNSKYITTKQNCKLEFKFFRSF